MNVLVIDDSTAMRLIIKRMLKAAGFSATFSDAADGLLGLEKIRESCPDLVLCDWNMPNMTGIELLQKLNEEQISVNFGFVTTEASPEMRKLATDNGAKFLITKPFTETSIQEALGAFF